VRLWRLFVAVVIGGRGRSHHQVLRCLLTRDARFCRRCVPEMKSSCDLRHKKGARQTQTR
jgi:hypothetical protein